MAYVSEPIDNLARTARNMAILTGCAGLVGAAGIAYMIANDSTPERITFGIRMFLATSLVPAVLLFVLSFAVGRGKVWAGPALVLVCVAQLPGSLYCGGCFAILPSAYLLARCLIAWPEITFQIRAARRNRADRRRGFEPVPAAAGAAAAAAVAVGAPGGPGARKATLLVPKSLKPSSRNAVPDVHETVTPRPGSTPPPATQP
jgi:hypothetical protein